MINMSSAYQKLFTSPPLPSGLLNLDAGTKMVPQGTGSQAREGEVNRFTHYIKLLGLLKSVGQECRQVIASVGFRATTADSTNNGALTLLDGYFSREKSLLRLRNSVP